MHESKQHEKQLEYFTKEFSQVEKYSLPEWAAGYIERIKKHLLSKDFRGKTLLDIATGTGYVAVEMAKLGMNVIACDLNPVSIKNLESYKKEFDLNNLTLFESKAEKIALQDESVDYIVANAILEHIPNEAEAIQEWKRLLKKDGRLFITVPLKFRYIWPFLWIPNFMHDKQIGHLRRYDLSILQKKFDMKLVKYFYTGHLVKIYPMILAKLKVFNKFLANGTFEMRCEAKDRQKEDVLYGANNISIILE